MEACQVTMDISILYFPIKTRVMNVIHCLLQRTMIWQRVPWLGFQENEFIADANYLLAVTNLVSHLTHRIEQHTQFNIEF